MERDWDWDSRVFAEELRPAEEIGRITADSDVSLCAASASLTDIAGSSDAALAEPARWLREAGALLASSV